MRICFFGWKNAFDYFRIGGAESYIRRLALGLVEHGHLVDYIMYGANENRQIIPNDFQVKLIYVKEFKKALQLLNENSYDVIVNMYIHPKYRPIFYGFRVKNRNRMLFSTILFSPFKSNLKLFLGGYDLKSYDKVFVVSKRIKDQLDKKAINAKLLNPPVSDIFFEVAKSRKPPQERHIKVGYIGRADYGKGFDLVLEAFENLDKRFFVPKIMTYAWKNETFLLEKAKKSKNVKVEISDYKNFTPAIEKRICNFLATIDILVLPYRTLDTTLDLPMSVIEGRITGAKVLTTDIHELKIINETLDCDLDFWDMKEPLVNATENVSIGTKRNIIFPDKFRCKNVSKAFLKYLEEDN